MVGGIRATPTEYLCLEWLLPLLSHSSHQLCTLHTSVCMQECVWLYVCVRDDVLKCTGDHQTHLECTIAPIGDASAHCLT